MGSELRKNMALKGCTSMTEKGRTDWDILIRVGNLDNGKVLCELERREHLDLDVIRWALASSLEQINRLIQVREVEHDDNIH